MFNTKYVKVINSTYTDRDDVNKMIDDICEVKTIYFDEK